jgi:integrase
MAGTFRSGRRACRRSRRASHTARKKCLMVDTLTAGTLGTTGRRCGRPRGVSGLRFHDLRRTVVTDLLEAGEPEHVVEAITGHLSRRMLEHYSHQRLKAKGEALTRKEERRKKKVRDFSK